MVIDAAPISRRFSFRRFLLERAFWILSGFTLLFLVTCLPIPSQHPSQAALIPAYIAFALGAATWVTTFLVCVHAFFIPTERPSFIASLSFFLILGVELSMVAEAIRFM